MHACKECVLRPLSAVGAAPAAPCKRVTCTHAPDAFIPVGPHANTAVRITWRWTCHACIALLLKAWACVWYAARSTSKVDITSLESIKLSPAVALTKQIITHKLFPTQLAPFSLSKACALLDTDGFVCISYSRCSLGDMVMWARSNVAALSVLAHSIAQLGMPISHASIHKIHDRSAGRYVHDEKVDLLLYKGSLQHSWLPCCASTAA